MTPRWKRIVAGGVVAELIRRSPKLAHSQPKDLTWADRPYVLSQEDKNRFGERVSKLVGFTWNPRHPTFGERPALRDLIVHPLGASLPIDRFINQAQGEWIIVEDRSSEAKMVFTLYAEEEGDLILFDLLA